MVNKPTKQQYRDYSRHATAINSLDRQLADLNAFVQLLKRTNDVDHIDIVRERLFTFLSSLESEYLATLNSDDDGKK